MKSKRRAGKSLSSERKKRLAQSKKLQDRVKLGQERSRGKRKGILKDDISTNSWYPKDGTHIVDVIPYTAGKHDPLVSKGDPTYTFECWVHTRVGTNKVMLLCMAEMYGEPCPICEERQKLHKQGAREELWKKLFPKRRNLYNIICYDKDEEKKGIQIWDISYHYFEKQVLAISKKPSRSGGAEKLVNFADIENGKSVSFTVEPAKSKEDFPSYLGHSFDERDYEIDDTLLDSAVVLDEVIHRPSYDEVSKAYWSEEGGEKKSKGKDDSKEDSEELEDLLDELDDLDDMDDIKDFIEDNDLDVKVRRKDDEEDVKEKIAAILKKEHGGGNKDKEELEELLDEVDDMDDMDSLEEFIEEHDLKIKIRRRDDEESIQNKITKALEGKYGNDDIPF